MLPYMVKGISNWIANLDDGKVTLDDPGGLT